MIELKWLPDQLAGMTIAQLKCLIEEEPPDKPEVRVANSAEEYHAIQTEIQEREAEMNKGWDG